jgi:hypothetical protein
MTSRAGAPGGPVSRFKDGCIPMNKVLTPVPPPRSGLASPLPLLLLILLPVLCNACGDSREGTPGEGRAPDTLTAPGRLRATVEILAADSMEGRLTGTRGAAMAADYVALELEGLGLEPAFPTGFLQPVPLARVLGEEGLERLVLANEEAPPGLMVLERFADVNVGALLRGRQRDVEEELVVLCSHFDALGFGPLPGGGGPDESGALVVPAVAAMLESARALTLEGPGGRTILFLFTMGGEEGELGARWYLRHPALPLERTVAAIQLEGVGHSGLFATEGVPAQTLSLPGGTWGEGPGAGSGDPSAYLHLARVSEALAAAARRAANGGAFRDP